MKTKTKIIIAAAICFCILAACITPAIAAGDNIDAEISAIVNDNSKTSEQKLAEQCQVFGWDYKLSLYVNAEKDEETGEPIYTKTENSAIDYIMSVFGVTELVPDELYDTAAGDAAYLAYLENYCAHYQPTA